MVYNVDNMKKRILMRISVKKLVVWPKYSLLIGYFIFVHNKGIHRLGLTMPSFSFRQGDQSVFEYEDNINIILYACYLFMEFRNTIIIHHEQFQSQKLSLQI